MRMSGNLEQDPTDEHHTVLVQVPTARLDEIKQQWDEVKKLIKENRPRIPETSIRWRAVVLVATLAVVGWLAYAAYDDLAMRQREIVMSQVKMVERVEELRREVEREVKELKSHLGGVVRNSSVDEIKLMRSMESTIRRLEEKLKAQ